MTYSIHDLSPAHLKTIVFDQFLEAVRNEQKILLVNIADVTCKETRCFGCNLFFLRFARHMPNCSSHFIRPLQQQQHGTQ